jgi:alpha-1,3-glucan synthase
MQKGIDIIADVFFSVLDDNPKTQLICVGPVIDLYGKFAQKKLEKLTSRFPGRVFSKPEFTALPPYIFSGAEFALIPSRDEPFGLVAVEFGRKGALGVGSRVGGLGLMPGWWYTVESLTSIHLINQFKQAIRNALGSDQATRANMRAQALVQRFPVQEWVEDLDKLQSTSVRISRQQQDRRSISRNILWTRSPSTSGTSTPTFTSGAQTPVCGRSSSPSLENASSGQVLTLPNLSCDPLPRVGSDQSFESHLHGQGSAPQPATRARPSAWYRNTSSGSYSGRLATPETSSQRSKDKGTGVRWPSDSRRSSPPSSEPSSTLPTPSSSSWNLPRFGRRSAAPSPLCTPRSEVPTNESGGDPTSGDPIRGVRKCFSYDTIIEKRKDFELQKVGVIFTDSQNEFYNKFARSLDRIDAKSSEGKLCIEQFLTKSEKAWFGRFHRATLGMDPQAAAPTTISGLFRWLKDRWHRQRPPLEKDHAHSEGRRSAAESIIDKEFLLGSHYEPPSGIKKLLQKKIGDWQLYCFLLAFVSTSASSMASSRPC